MNNCFLINVIYVRLLSLIIVFFMIKSYFDTLYQTLNLIDTRPLEKIIDLIFEAMIKEKQIFILGNGGSASTASHMACDLIKNHVLDPYNNQEKRCRVICVNDNMATITAYANDHGYETVFEQQLRTFLTSGDVVIAISASGNSPNIIKAIEYARQKKATTIAMVGFSGGKLKTLYDLVVHYPEKHYGRSEDAHLIINHIITDALKLRKQKNNIS